jgi:hypothetical protein
MAEQLGFSLAIIAPDEYRAMIAKRPRRCLSCDRQFASTGPGNRICCKCKDLESWSGSHPVEFPVHAAF